MNIPTQETFERYVSAFRDAESRIYDAVKPFMAQYIARIIDPLHIPSDFARPALHVGSDLRRDHQEGP